MDLPQERQGAEALRAYVSGESSEPVVLSAFRAIPLEARADLVSRHRPELEAISTARLTILESLLLPFGHRIR